jgi:ADP-ribosyl-[dinitrogen reductase] hydrolase
MKGSCHCGAVAYEAGPLVGPINHCHCITCRKTHSAAYNTAARVAREGFRWLRGEDSLKAYESTPGKKRWFCSNCGCHLAAMLDNSSYVILRLGSLDDDPGARPQQHIWRSHDVPWLADVPGMDSFPEFRPEEK